VNNFFCANLKKNVAPLSFARYAFPMNKTIDYANEKMEAAINAFNDAMEAAINAFNDMMEKIFGK
jgi:hypothetical protein